jgi:hypothetical protein
MEWNFLRMITPPPIMGVTINTVFLSPSVRLFLYFLIGSVLLLGTISGIRKKVRPSVAFRSAVVAAFFVSGTLYALQADTGWTMWLVNDARTFGGLSTDGKLLKMDDGIYAFAQKAREVVDGDYQLYASDGTVALRAEYFLLPLRKRAGANYLLVLADKEARFDPVAGTFTRGNVRIDHVEPVLFLARDAYILKRKAP